jgi:hypothetical protein
MTGGCEGARVAVKLTAAALRGDRPPDLTVSRGRAAAHEGLARRGPEGADLAAAGHRGWSAGLSVLIAAPAWLVRPYPDK